VKEASDRISEAAYQVPRAKHYLPVELTRQDLTRLFDAIGDHESIVSDLIAAIADEAVECARHVGVVAPGYSSDLLNLDPHGVDQLVRPVFEAAGIAEDFIPWRERFPDETDGIPDIGSRRHYRFHFKLGGLPAELGPGQRALSPADQEKIFADQINRWEPIDFEGRRIGTSRYIELADGVIKGEAILEPGETLPPILQVDHVATVSVEANKATFMHSRVEAKPVIDSVDEVDPDQS